MKDLRPSFCSYYLNTSVLGKALAGCHDCDWHKTEPPDHLKLATEEQTHHVAEKKDACRIRVSFSCTAPNLLKTFISWDRKLFVPAVYTKYWL